MNVEQIFRAWMLMTAVLVISFFVWAYVPIIIPLAVVFAALGGITLVIRRIARRYQRDDPELP